MDLSACSARPATSKRCFRCKGLHSTSDFSVDKSKPDGRSIYCRTCKRKIQKKNRPSKELRKSKRSRYARSDRNWRLKTLYGITVDQFEAIFAAQGNKCALCKSEKSDGKNFVVDHCHKTGRIRGILCSYCNRALGMFKDSVDLLGTAIVYLSK